MGVRCWRVRRPNSGPAGAVTGPPVERCRGCAHTIGLAGVSPPREMWPVGPGALGRFEGDFVRCTPGAQGAWHGVAGGQARWLIARGSQEPKGAACSCMIGRLVVLDGGSSLEKEPKMDLLNCKPARRKSPKESRGSVLT